MSELVGEYSSDHEQHERVEALEHALQAMEELNSYLNDEFDGDTEYIEEDFEYIHEEIDRINRLLRRADLIDTIVDTITPASCMYEPTVAYNPLYPETVRISPVPFAQKHPNNTMGAASGELKGVELHLQTDQDGMHPGLFYSIYTSEISIPGARINPCHMVDIENTHIVFENDPRETHNTLKSLESDEIIAQYIETIESLGEYYRDDGSFEYTLTPLRSTARAVNKLLNLTEIGQNYDYQAEIASLVREQLPYSDELCDIQTSYIIEFVENESGTPQRRVLRNADVTLQIPSTLFCLSRTILTKDKRPTTRVDPAQTGLFIVVRSEHKTVHIPLEAIKKITPTPPDEDEDDL